MAEPDAERPPLRAPSPEVEAVLEAVLREVEGGAWEEASDRLMAALELHPEDPWILCWLGLAEREMGLEGSAWERFRRALAAGPEDPVLLATVGNALAAADDPSAGEALRTAALLAPELPQARWMYGAYLSREGMFAEAVDELAAARRLDPDDPVIATEMGVARALAGEMDQAAEAFEEAVRLDPDDGWAILLLGLARLEAGEMEDAVPLLEEGARLRPEDLDAQLLAGVALAASGWEDRALEMVERARLHAEGADLTLVEEAEERVDEGGEAARAFLMDTIAPSSFRERLLERP